MVDRQIERAAYIAAHAISTADLVAAELVCPGARNTYKVDVIAGIIKNVFEAMEQTEQTRIGNMLPDRDWRVSPVASASQPMLLTRRGA